VARSLLLDLDGTLVDTVPDLAAALNRLMQQRGLAPFSLPEVALMIGDGVAVLVGRAFAARGRDQDNQALPEFNHDYAEHLADASRPFPGIPDFLRAFSDAGWRMAVCTNKPEAAARKLLGALDLLRYIAAVGGGDSFPVRKPDPAHLLATLKEIDGDPASTAMVGDHRNDVAAAKGAGVKSVFVTWGYGPIATGQGADAMANDLTELTRELRLLVPLTA
jgi:phosphoglycolate phosphatase